MDTESDSTLHAGTRLVRRVAAVGAGPHGTALVAAGIDVAGPLGRDPVATC